MDKRNGHNGRSRMTGRQFAGGIVFLLMVARVIQVLFGRVGVTGWEIGLVAALFVMFLVLTE